MTKKDSGKGKVLRRMDPPFHGHYYMHEDMGVYKCKSCETPLFSSKAKIYTGSGWPSFDAALTDSIQLKKGEAKRGKEVFCVNCKQFLGLLIEGENFTAKRQRFDINSTALTFTPSTDE